MKKILLAASLLLTTAFAGAQTFLHGIGTGFSVTTMKTAETAVFGTLMYNPRFTLTETESSSLTIGLPLTLGFAGEYSYSSYYGEQSDIRYVLNAPLILNMNWGAGSSKITEDRFGFFVGGGFGINTGSFVVEETIIDAGYEYISYEKQNVTTYGPAANAGVRFGVGNKTKNIEVLLSYMKGINDHKPNSYALQAVFNF
jgi:opacity protein-like surface antigen